MVSLYRSSMMELYLPVLIFPPLPTVQYFLNQRTNFSHVLHCILKRTPKELSTVSASVYYSACHRPCQAKPRETFFLETPVFKGFLMSV